MRIPLLLSALCCSAPLAAQQPAPAPLPALPQPLAVGAVAPDFTLPAATAAGVAAKPFRLSEHRGQTVVLAFFFKARTAG